MKQIIACALWGILSSLMGYSVTTLNGLLIVFVGSVMVSILCDNFNFD